VKRLVLIATAAALVLAAAAGPAAAKVGRCLGGKTGPRCHFWTGKVTRVNDGDTMHVDIDRDGTHRARTVRFINVQAMEQSVYSKHPARRRGECHALEATARLERLIRAGHKRVRLSAQNPRSHAGRRLRRSIAVKVKGHWRDLGRTMIGEGHALWMADTAEWAWNARYNVAQQRAARKGKNLWNPVHCGAGPAQEVPLRLWVSWDPVGVDTADINGEFVKIQNRSATTPLPLRGWWVRDAQHRRFKFPASAVILPGHTATVRAGRGTSSGERFYWGLRENPFQNPGDFRNLGDGGYLFDPKGDLRAYMLYPCRVACTDPNRGAVRVSAEPVGEEYVLFRNVSGHTVDLYGYAMTTKGSSYPFGENSALAPGEEMRVDIEGDPRDDTRLHRHWGRNGRNLPNEGGWVHLETFTDITIGCDSWGSGSC
jgi:endonuclease YncB( thermonuclease family)